ncbi:MAG: nicotinate-nucleotide diphosphorylase (carboxylating), partial [Flavobacteriaceae bacterium]
VCLQHKWISRVLLDNMSPNELTSAVKLIDGALPTEASGNITPENCVAYAESGVDFISLGYITHSAPIIDLSLRAV